MKFVILLLAAMLTATPALARKSCEELKSELEAKIRAKGVTTFTLTILPKAEPTELRAVGNCEGGTKKIVYKRG